MSSGYDPNNVTNVCVCGVTRTDIPENIWRVSDKENDVIIPKYYYRCPTCRSFSAPNIYFPADKYEQQSLEHFFISNEKGHLNRIRAELLAGFVSPVTRRPVVFDLGSGEGAFTNAIVEVLPDAFVYACETDTRLQEKFYADRPNVKFVPQMIETFLDQIDVQADVCILFDVLEHVIRPDKVIEKIARRLKPGGLAYITVPNSDTFSNPYRVLSTAVDWEHANRSCQHLWMLTPQIITRVATGIGPVIWQSDSLETYLRRDSQYTSLIVKRETN
jgi:SAM-dependent methyltransferase